MSLATPPKLRRLQEALYTKAKQAPAYRFYLLYDKVYRADILAHAYALSQQRGGVPGVDIEIRTSRESPRTSTRWPITRVGTE